MSVLVTRQGVCEGCSEAFSYQARPSRFRRYCSRACAVRNGRWRDRTLPPPISCRLCRGRFIARRERQVFCSLSCAARWGNTARQTYHGPLLKPCARCGTTFVTNDSRQRYCSLNCAAAWGHEARRGVAS